MKYGENVVRKKVTVTLEPKVITRLKALARRNNRSMSNMIEILVMAEYEDNDSLQHQLAKDRIDKL